MHIHIHQTTVKWLKHYCILTPLCLQQVIRNWPAVLYMLLMLAENPTHGGRRHFGPSLQVIEHCVRAFQPVKLFGYIEICSEYMCMM